MITVVEGRPGMGKTVYLVYQIIEYLNRGYEVYTNVEINLPHSFKRRDHLHYISTLEDITSLREGKIVLDEIQTYLNSRNWDKLDIKFQLLLQQHRKRGLDIVGATQSIKRADVVFRELVQRFFTVRKIFSLRIPYTKVAFGFFVLREYDPDTTEGDATGRKQLGHPVPLYADPFIFKVYDTTQEYKIESPIGKRFVEEYVIVEKPQQVKHLLTKKEI